MDMTVAGMFAPTAAHTTIRFRVRYVALWAEELPSRRATRMPRELFYFYGRTYRNGYSHTEFATVTWEERKGGRRAQRLAIVTEVHLIGEPPIMDTCGVVLMSTTDNTTPEMFRMWAQAVLGVPILEAYPGDWATITKVGS